MRWKREPRTRFFATGAARPPLARRSGALNASIGSEALSSPGEVRQTRRVTCRSKGEVETLLSYYDYFGDRGDLDGLAVDLPNLHRPCGFPGECDVARYKMLPPALRAASVFFTLRAEVANGGIDQFVYNQLSILPETIDAFAHIGATGTAAFLLELGSELLSDAEYLDDDAVGGFLAFRSATNNEGWESGGDVDEVRDALVRHAKKHPEEFVLPVVEEREWCNDHQTFRATIVLRPDALHEVLLAIAVEDKWVELSTPPETLSLDDVRRRIDDEINQRQLAPKRCTFGIDSCREQEDGEVRLRATETLGLDALPFGPLALAFVRGEETFHAKGRFMADLSSYAPSQGAVHSARKPPDAEKRPTGWTVTCTSEV